MLEICFCHPVRQSRAVCKYITLNRLSKPIFSRRSSTSEIDRARSDDRSLTKQQPEVRPPGRSSLSRRTLEVGRVTPATADCVLRSNGGGRFLLALVRRGRRRALAGQHNRRGRSPFAAIRVPTRRAARAGTGWRGVGVRGGAAGVRRRGGLITYDNCDGREVYFCSAPTDRPTDQSGPLGVQNFPAMCSAETGANISPRWRQRRRPARSIAADNNRSRNRTEERCGNWCQVQSIDMNAQSGCCSATGPDLLCSTVFHF